ncbi:helix-turn-helix transcriptional regulator, partial [bacterium]|nr:helix-turn-helix transcriptional regulator [bacterium]
EMSKYKQINETTGRMGAMLRRARRVCNMSTDEAAELLRAPPQQMFEYEHGITEIPQEILESMFIMGYKMKQVRILEKRYAVMRDFLRMTKQDAVG